MRGSCLCGAVVYEVEALDSPPRHCSCSMCRKAHAAAFNTSAGVSRSRFKWVQGEAVLRAYESSPGKRRYFCGNCGSQLIAHRDGSATIALRVATLDDDPGQRPHAHIWVSQEVAWLNYTTDVRSYAEWEPKAK
ncbi:MAG TPA: GFA family protein [Casimicrobiaceae bacterium]